MRRRIPVRWVADELIDKGEKAWTDDEKDCIALQGTNQFDVDEAPNSYHLYRTGEDENFFKDVDVIALQLENHHMEQRDAFRRMFYKYARLFSYKTEGAGSYEHRIRLKDSKAIVRRSYPVPFALRDAVGREISEMLATGIIERSESPHCNPLRIVEKKDGRVRVGLDARVLNNVIETDNESLPIIGEILQKYYGTKIMSITDLAYGYW